MSIFSISATFIFSGSYMTVKVLDLSQALQLEIPASAPRVALAVSVATSLSSPETASLIMVPSQQSAAQAPGHLVAGHFSAAGASCA